MEKRYTLH